MFLGIEWTKNCVQLSPVQFSWTQTDRNTYQPVSNPAGLSQSSHKLKRDKVYFHKIDVTIWSLFAPSKI